MASLAVPIAVREKEVSGEVMRLEAAIKDADTAVSGLYDSLNSVMRSGNEGSASEKTPEPVLCPLAEQVRALRKRLETVVVGLQTIQSRLEV
jgi:archaellum component FlaC